MFEIDSLKIKSYRREYTVDFCNLNKELLNFYDDNTRIIIDSNIYKKYPIFKQYFDASNMYIIEASEQTKTLKTCEEIISFLISSNFSF